MSFKFFLVYSITVFVASIIPGPSMLLAFSKAMIGRYINRIIGTTFVGAGIGLAAIHK